MSILDLSSVLTEASVEHIVVAAYDTNMEEEIDSAKINFKSSSERRKDRIKARKYRKAHKNELAKKRMKYEKYRKTHKANSARSKRAKLIAKHYQNSR